MREGQSLQRRASGSETFPQVSRYSRSSLLGNRNVRGPRQKADRWGQGER